MNSIDSIVIDEFYVQSIEWILYTLVAFSILIDSIEYRMNSIDSKHNISRILYYM